MNTPEPFSLLIKPASGDCNLACDYCFYRGKTRLFPATPTHRMNDAVLERMIATYLQTAQPQYTFGWQGGEPTLMGVEFFRRVTDLQLRHAPRGASIANGLQTNATLIDDPFAAHLAEYRFLLGVSLDGPADIHDRYRLTRAGRGSYADVRHGIDCLQRHGVEFNILVLVTQANVRRAPEVYRYLCAAGYLFHQYIPCVEFDADDRPQPFAVNGDEWGTFLCELYDAWRGAGDTRGVSIRHFDALLEQELTGRAHVCTLSRNCCQYLVVEHNGDLFPCDFFVEPRYRIGNIMETTWEQARSAPVYREFGAQKSLWNAACDNCPWIAFCAGDCLKHRFIGSRPDPRTVSWLCTGWQRFFAHAMPGLRELADGIRRDERQRQQDAESAMAGASALRGPQRPRPGRNAPCPCGSGRKFKHCCGR